MEFKSIVVALSKPKSSKLKNAQQKDWKEVQYSVYTLLSFDDRTQGINKRRGAGWRLKCQSLRQKKKKEKDNCIRFEIRL